jgi:hypothetical protein
VEPFTWTIGPVLGVSFARTSIELPAEFAATLAESSCAHKML